MTPKRYKFRSDLKKTAVCAPRYPPFVARVCGVCVCGGVFWRTLLRLVLRLVICDFGCLTGAFWIKSGEAISYSHRILVTWGLPNNLAE